MTARQKKLFILCSVGILLCLGWFLLLTPKITNIQIIYPNLSTDYDAPSSYVLKSYHEEDDGIFWMKFTTKGSFLTVDKLRLRTLSCVNSLGTDNTDWTLPADWKVRCDNTEGIRLTHFGNILKNDTSWNLGGDTNGRSFGFYLDKDWSDIKLILGMVLLSICLSGAFYLALPLKKTSLRLLASGIFLFGFLLRFWTTQIAMPPEINLFSDMQGYFDRSVEIMSGRYDLGQTFQPIGYTFYSLALRYLGSWELLKWVSIFLSVGIMLFAFLLVLEYFGKTAALLTLAFVAIDIPQIGFTARHMAESPYSFLIMLSLWWLMRTLNKPSTLKFVGVGALLMIAFYFKGNHVFFIPFFALWLLYRERYNLLSGIRKVAATAVGCLLVMTPHLAFTKAAYGQAQWGPTAGALNFVEGKCPWKNNQDTSGASWMSPLFVSLGETTFRRWDRPFIDQAYFWKQGLNCIQENPWVMAESLRYINYLFYGNSTWPIAGSEIGTLYDRWAPMFEMILLPLAVLGALGYARRRNDLNEVAALMALAIFLTVYVFKSENRFRVPFDPLFLMWSSLGITWCVEKVRAWLPIQKFPLPEQLPTGQ